MTNTNMAERYAEDKLGQNYDLVLRIADKIQDSGAEFPNVEDYASMNSYIEDRTPNSRYKKAIAQQKEICALWTPIQSNSGPLGAFFGGGDMSQQKSTLEDILAGKKNNQEGSADIGSMLTSALLGGVQNTTKNAIYALAAAVGEEYAPAELWSVLSDMSK